MMTTALQMLTSLPPSLVIGVVAVVLVIESGTLVGMFVPGSTLLVALGLWSQSDPATLGPAIAAVAVGTVSGAHLAWWRGHAGAVAHRGGTGPVGRSRRMVAAWVVRAATAVSGRGAAEVVVTLAVGHWAAAARPILPRLAGASAVPYRLAGPVLAITGAAWSTTLVLVGNRLRPELLAELGWIPVAVVVVLVGAVASRRKDDRRFTGHSARRVPR